MPEVITNNLDLWSSALFTKSTAGRGSNGKQEAYGIKKLRELILELAVRGKLVPQDSNDEPASVLLEKITKEKARLIKEEEIKKEKSLPDIGDDEKPFGLPNGWQWSRLKDVSSYIQRGKGPQYADYGKVQVVSQKCIQWSGFDLSQARYVDDGSLDGYQPERFLKKDDLLWNSTGTGTVGRINVVPAVETNLIVADSHVTIIRPLIVNSNFLCCYVAAPGIQQRIEPEHENSLVSGTTNQVELNLSAVIQLVVPVPPLAEQHRIVAKVDELLALCDQLEQQQTHSIEAHQTLVETLLGTLTRVESQQELTEAWTRNANHFDTLFTTEHSFDQLKQTILQLAVMGKLVPQDPNDEPASELLKQIAGEREKLSKAGKIKKQKELPQLCNDEMPFTLPTGWQWIALSQLGAFSGGKTPSKMKSAYWDGDIPWVTPKDMKVLQIFDTEDHVTEAAISDGLELYEPESVLFVVRSGILRRAFPVAVAKVRCTVNQDLKVLSLFKKDLAAYVLLMMRGFERYILKNLTKTGMTVESVLFDEFASHYFMLPPLTEQHRIVAKVNELMALCETLKARLKDVQTTQIHLADTIVEQAVA